MHLEQDLQSSVIDLVVLRSVLDAKSEQQCCDDECKDASGCYRRLPFDRESQ